MGATYDASTTNLTYHIPGPVTTEANGPLEVVISFLSPITPTSTLRQSIPASYITVHVSGGFNVDIYIDVNGQWVSGDRGAQIVWDFEQEDLPKGKGLKTWKVKRQTEELLSEIRDRAEWGTLHFSAPAVSRSSWLAIRYCSLKITGRPSRIRNLGPAAPSLLSNWHSAEYHRR